jgi:hypothetical protein
VKREEVMDVDLDASFDNILDWKGEKRRGRDVNNENARSSTVVILVFNYCLLPFMRPFTFFFRL